MAGIPDSARRRPPGRTSAAAYRAAAGSRCEFSSPWGCAPCGDDDRGDGMAGVEHPLGVRLCSACRLQLLEVIPRMMRRTSQRRGGDQQEALAEALLLQLPE